MALECDVPPRGAIRFASDPATHCPLSTTRCWKLLKVSDVSRSLNGIDHNACLARELPLDQPFLMSQKTMG